MTIEEIVEKYFTFRVDKVVSSELHRKVADDNQTIIESLVEVSMYRAISGNECATGKSVDEAVNNLVTELAKREE